MSKLEEELQKRGIAFDKVQRRIRYISRFSLRFAKWTCYFRCFPHIVNLACKAILSAITNLDYAQDPPEGGTPPSSLENVDGDPIAKLRSLIQAVSYYKLSFSGPKLTTWQIRASSLRRHHFVQIAKTFQMNLELLRDVDTRWSSTYLMILRALELESVCIFSF